MSKSDHTEYIARISKGKDSLKMLDVIWTRGLPLDRITTTDVWATDTVPAWLPPMQEFMDPWTNGSGADTTLNVSICAP